MSTAGIHARVIVTHHRDGTLTVSEDMPLEQAERLAESIESASSYNELRVVLERA